MPLAPSGSNMNRRRRRRRRKKERKKEKNGNENDHISSISRNISIQKILGSVPKT
jgi:hypothetical protein